MTNDSDPQKRFMLALITWRQVDPTAREKLLRDLGNTYSQPGLSEAIALLASAAPESGGM
jgi:hypothetical protein